MSRTRRTSIASTLAVALVAALAGVAHTEVGPAAVKHEVGLGGATLHGFEKDVFNVPDDDGIPGGNAFFLTYYQNLDDQLAVGAHVIGNEATLDDYVMFDGMSSQPVELDFTSTTVGARVRYSLMPGATIRPYGILGASLETGNMENDALGSLSYTGLSGSGGIGALLRLGRQLAIGAEALGTLGFASWSEKPATNSRDSGFDPSSIGGYFYLSFGWGSPSGGEDEPS